MSYTAGQTGRGFSQPAKEYITFPMIIWANGNQRERNRESHPYTGGFYIKASDAQVEFPGGTPDTMVYARSQGTEPIFWLGKPGGAVTVAFLGERMKMEIPGPDGRPRFLINPEGGWPQGAKVSRQFVVFVREAEAWHAQYGPLLMSFKGGKAGAFNAHVYKPMRKIHAAIEKMSGIPLDMHTFWWGIKPGPFETRFFTNDKGEQEAGSTVTDPVLATLKGYTDEDFQDPERLQEYAERVTVPLFTRELALPWLERIEAWMNPDPDTAPPHTEEDDTPDVGDAPPLL